MPELRVPSTSLGSVTSQDVDVRHKAGHDGSSIMARKIVTGIIVVPLAIIIIVFAVANRQMVTVSFDPFSATAPAYAVPLPLFVLIFIVLILGVSVGGVAAWLGQSSWRRTARKLDADMRALHDELETVRRRFGTQAQGAQPERPVIPPPASLTASALRPPR
jgi:uncharacterized integral membrane protein